MVVAAVAATNAYEKLRVIREGSSSMKRARRKAADDDVPEQAAFALPRPSKTLTALTTRPTTAAPAAKARRRGDGRITRPLGTGRMTQLSHHRVTEGQKKLKE